MTWIFCDGQAPDLPANTLVDFRRRGDVRGLYSRNFVGKLGWTDTGSSFDIVSYRLSPADAQLPMLGTGSRSPA